MNDGTPIRHVAAAPQQTALRIDLALIAEMIEPGSRVLDIGCGNGELLKFLEDNKRVDGRGIELSQSGVNFCVAKGLSVVQGDADRDLSYYPDGASITPSSARRSRPPSIPSAC
jgi:SAM-dependent methyltransferase